MLSETGKMKLCILWPFSPVARGLLDIGLAEVSGKDRVACPGFLHLQELTMQSHSQRTSDRHGEAVVLNL